MPEHPRIPRVPDWTMHALAQHPHRDEASLILDYYGLHPRSRRPVWVYHYPLGEVWRTGDLLEILPDATDALAGLTVAKPPAVAILTPDAQRRVLDQTRQSPPADLTARLAGKLTADDLRALLREHTR